jgi:hypothetical protein
LSMNVEKVVTVSPTTMLGGKPPNTPDADGL